MDGSGVSLGLSGAGAQQLSTQQLGVGGVSGDAVSSSFVHAARAGRRAHSAQALPPPLQQQPPQCMLGNGTAGPMRGAGSQEDVALPPPRPGEHDRRQQQVGGHFCPVLGSFFVQC